MNECEVVVNIACSSSDSSSFQIPLEKPYLALSPVLLLRLVQLFINLMNEVNLLFVLIL
jgi:hypothetical protein